MTARVRLGALAIIATATTAAPVSAAEYGSRTMREGVSGKDVKQLQRYLTATGYDTTADGAFGPLTARSVRRFERSDGLQVNGVVPPKDARIIERAALKATPEQTEDTTTTESTEQGEAYITRDGLAVAPADAPAEVRAVIEAGNEIATKPYKYGGGHGDWEDSGYDCSGSVSYALHGAGLVSRPRDSGEFMTWGRAGRGEWITVYAHGGHAYIVVAGYRFDTSMRDADAPGPSTGPRWSKSLRRSSAFVARHPRGY
jgi:peptidoglycan hydrolase-like protein with peptidoglycan-binding domain